MRTITLTVQLLCTSLSIFLTFHGQSLSYTAFCAWAEFSRSSYSCDPGFAYEFARQISSARIFRRRYKMPHMWPMRREHINSPAEIISVLRSGFEEIDRTYFPLGLVPVTT